MSTIIKHIDYDFNGFEANLRALKQEFPFLKVESIGKSVAGRDIKMLSVGSGNQKTLYTAAMHGSEHITATVLLRFAESLCRAIKENGKLSGIDAQRAMHGKTFMLVPMCNPDGCEISVKGEIGCGAQLPLIKRLSGGDYLHWNSNLRGVDLNHNFDAGWERLHALERENGYFGPGPTRFGGNRPHSEPETVALTELCRKHTFRHLVCFHSQGEVIYWDYNGIDTMRGKKMAEIFAASSGYALDVPPEIAQGGGFKDWFIETFRRPAFTVELGSGKNPLPPTAGEEIYRKTEEMMALGILM